MLLRMFSYWSLGAHVQIVMLGLHPRVEYKAIEVHTFSFSRECFLKWYSNLYSHQNHFSKGTQVILKINQVWSHRSILLRGWTVSLYKKGSPKDSDCVVRERTLRRYISPDSEHPDFRGNQVGAAQLSAIAALKRTPGLSRKPS